MSCFRQLYSLFVCFSFRVPPPHLFFQKILLMIYQPYSPLSMSNQAFAHFGLEIIRRSSITRPLEGQYSLMILRTLITWYSTPLKSLLHLGQNVITFRTLFFIRSWQLCKPETTSRVCITVSNSPNPSSVYIRLSTRRKKVFYCLNIVF